MNGITFIGKNRRPVIWGVPCIKDKKYKGSVWETMEMSEWICPHCKAHLSNKQICLNACHLTAASLKRFSQLMAQT